MARLQHLRLTGPHLTEHGRCSELRVSDFTGFNQIARVPPPLSYYREARAVLKGRGIQRSTVWPPTALPKGYIFCVVGHLE